MRNQKNLRQRMSQHLREYRRLTARLARIGWIWPGSIQQRMITCGKKNCSCRSTPEARHGPYMSWTTKQDKKTVGRLLTPEEAAVYGEWIENRRELDKILHQMKKRSHRASRTALALYKQRQLGEARNRSHRSLI